MNIHKWSWVVYIPKVKKIGTCCLAQFDLHLISWGLVLLSKSAKRLLVMPGSVLSRSDRPLRLHKAVSCTLIAELWVIKYFIYGSLPISALAGIV